MTKKQLRQFGNLLVFDVFDYKTTTINIFINMV